MTHVKTQIKDEAIAILVAGDFTADQVLNARVLDVTTASLPAVLVYTNDETVERGTGRKQVRTLELMFEVIAKGENLDDQLDSLAVQVETVINDAAFSVLIKSVDLVQISKTFSKGGDYQLGTANILYNVVYLTIETTPETARN